MPRPCCVPGCKANYKSSLKRGDSAKSTFSFPKDNELKKKWTEVIPRKDWTPSCHSGVCELHFHPNEIIKFGKYLLPDGTLTMIPYQPKLKKNTVPSIFPNYTSVLTTKENLEENTNIDDYRFGNLLQIEKLEEPEIIKEELDIKDDGDIHIKEESREKVIERDEENPKRLQSPICEYENRCRSNLSGQIKNVFEKKTSVLFSCQFCSFTCRYEREMKKHQLTHDDNKLFKCPDCHKGYDLKKLLDNHILKNHDNLCNVITSKIHSCHICSFKTTSKYRLLGHVNVIHLKMNQNQCYICSRVFAWKESLMKHISRVHSRLKPFICCKKSFMEKINFDCHIVAYHQHNVDLMKTLTNDILTCRYCPYKTCRKGLMTTHIKVHQRNSPSSTKNDTLVVATLQQ